MERDHWHEFELNECHLKASFSFRSFDKHCAKMKFSIKDFVSKCDQIRSKLRIWSHLLNKSLMENLNFCAVKNVKRDCQSIQNMSILRDVVLNQYK